MMLYRVMENVHRCSSRVKHLTTQPLDMGKICRQRGRCNSGWPKGHDLGLVKLPRRVRKTAYGHNRGPL